MYTTFLNTIGFPFLIVLGATLALHLLGRILFLSPHRRSKKLFADTHWLPLRIADQSLDGEKVEFPSSERVTLRGTFIGHQAARRKGTVLFCHELNGTQDNITPYAKNLAQAGFDILAFDLRNHGQSDTVHHLHPTPWVTTTDMDDVRAAINYLESRTDTDLDGLCVFGFGKGATLALCAAGSDPRIRSVVLDAPVKENKLFAKNCRDLLQKSMRLSRRRAFRFFSLFTRALLYTATSPVRSMTDAWHRFVLGRWFGCRFVNPWTFAKNVHQPIMIVHGHVDSSVRPDQVQALRNRMLDRPRLWFISSRNQANENLAFENTVDENCSRQVARFFEEAIR